MGYFSLDIKKAKGTSDTTQSDHIERKIIPKNADPTRTHLNRVLVEYPDGVHGRDEAIAHRLNTAGIRRKITHDQVRVVRVVLSGTHEDMMNIQEKGKLDEWCNDSIQWLQATFGKDNVVAAHLHMDEKTPHIHAAVVPIVTGERRKAKKEQTDGKRKYRKKTNSVRLCADAAYPPNMAIALHQLILCVSVLPYRTFPMPIVQIILFFPSFCKATERCRHIALFSCGQVYLPYCSPPRQYLF